MSQQLPLEFEGRAPRGVRVVPPSRPRPIRQVRSQMNEKDWTRFVGKQATDWGWLRYHTFLSIHSTAGFPDECLVRPPRLIFAELKSEAGVVSPKQQEWLLALREIPGIEVYLWRPSDLDDVLRILAPAGWKYTLT